MKSQDLKPYKTIFKNTNSQVDKTIIKSIKKEYEINHESSLNEIHDLAFESINKICCPSCKSNLICKDGKSHSNNQIYKCKKCGKRFTLTSQTLFNSSKVNISAWISFIEGIITETSIKSACFKAKITIPTGLYRMKKIFYVLKDYQNSIKMNGCFYTDETYIGKEKGKKVKKTTGENYRGISKNQICIAILFDKKHVVFKMIGFGKPEKEIYFKEMKQYIDSNSTIIHDGELAHSLLIQNLNLKECFYKAKLSSKYNEEALKALEPINNECGLLKHFLEKHWGINKDNLQNWLNLYALIANHKIKDPNPISIIIDLIELLAKSNIRIKY